MDPAQTRASTISLRAAEKRLKCRVDAGVPVKRVLTMSNPTRSVPKKSSMTCRTALLRQLCPDGWSGKFGVVSGGAVTVDGSNKGSHAGSASVAGLLSVFASRIASIGRQKFQ